MQNIGGFFEKFNSKITKQVQSLAFVIDVIKKHTGITLDMKDISIRAGIIRIKASPVAKSEIFMKKQRILKDFKESALSFRVEDIQ